MYQRVRNPTTENGCGDGWRRRRPDDNENFWPSGLPPFIYCVLCSIPKDRRNLANIAHDFIPPPPAFCARVWEGGESADRWWFTASQRIWTISQNFSDGRTINAATAVSDRNTHTHTHTQLMCVSSGVYQLTTCSCRPADLLPSDRYLYIYI
jgi:hypothetical protein